MSLFSGIKEVSISKSGQYFKPGNYKVRIKAVKTQDSQVGPAKKFFIVETEVLKSSNPDIAVGSERSQIIDMSNVMALPNVKYFVAAASGVDPNSEGINGEVEGYWKKKLAEDGVLKPGEDVSFDQICELVVSAINPLGGIELDLECMNITTKGEGKEFTKHLWQPRVGA
jgi:hypothetical protein